MCIRPWTRRRAAAVGHTSAAANNSLLLTRRPAAKLSRPPPSRAPASPHSTPAPSCGIRAARRAMALQTPICPHRHAAVAGSVQALPDDRRRVRARRARGGRRHPAAPCLPDRRSGPTFAGGMQAGAVVVGASGAAVCHTDPVAPGQHVIARALVARPPDARLVPGTIRAIRTPQVASGTKASRTSADSFPLRINPFKYSPSCSCCVVPAEAS